MNIVKFYMKKSDLKSLLMRESLFNAVPGLHPIAYNIIKKKIPARVFSCEFCNIFPKQHSCITPPGGCIYYFFYCNLMSITLEGLVEDSQEVGILNSLFISKS